MGPIGERLPKILWPLFENILLEIQVLWLKSLGFHEIYINLCHDKKRIYELLTHRPCFENVHFILEETLLGAGGSIHYLAHKLDYDGKLFVFNADQFFIHDITFLKKMEIERSNDPVILSSVKIDPSLGYNVIDVDSSGFLRGIKSKEDLKKSTTLYPLTYSGLCLVDLSKLKERSGQSSFFDTISNFHEQNIKVIEPDCYEFWDFGTSKRYVSSLYSLWDKIIHNEKSHFITFLNSQHIMNPRLISTKSRSYGHDLDSLVLNFSKKIIPENVFKESIILEPPAVYQFDKKNAYCKAIIYDELVQKFNS